ncbi:MAG: MotA/TolQ/ExbB proton channel family protein [Candidatus Marinimicrobia bacterium]|nr:MotA/TolQ/ExbB proton channel family protein [Candidatus Neomarinimicrobiota bacterium]
MDLATIIGVMIGVGLIGGAIFMQAAGSGTNPIVFVDIMSIMIVLGGTLAATSIAFPLKEVVRLLTILRMVFKGARIELGALVDDVVDMSGVARKGPKDLEDALGNVRNPFLKDGLQMVVDGYSVEEIRDIMGTRVEYREAREETEAGLFKAMGKFSPAFGIIGTLIGLVFMLKGMGSAGGEDMAAQVGTGMATALITTFYGAVMANLFFLPMAEKLINGIGTKSTMQNMITEGVCMLQMKKHPLIVREKINSFIPPREWKRMEPGQAAGGGG